MKNNERIERNAAERFELMNRVDELMIAFIDHALCDDDEDDFDEITKQLREIRKRIDAIDAETIEFNEDELLLFDETYRANGISKIAKQSFSVIDHEIQIAKAVKDDALAEALETSLKYLKDVYV